MSTVALTISTAGATTSASAQTVSFSSREEILSELSRFEPQPATEEVWLDFAQIEIVGSHELSALIRFCLDLRQAGIRLRAVNVSAFVEEIFEITRFGKRQ